MNKKTVVATLYLKNGVVIKGEKDYTKVGDPLEICKFYNDNGFDKIIILDIFENEIEQEKNIRVIKQVNKQIDIKVCAGNTQTQLSDVKKYLYAGCVEVIFNGQKPISLNAAIEASKNYSKDIVVVAANSVDFIFKQKDIMNRCFHEVIIKNKELIELVENTISIPYIVCVGEIEVDYIVRILRHENVRGICVDYTYSKELDVMKLKNQLVQNNIRMDNYEPELHWDDLKKNSDKMVPVIVQDYRNDEVLMLAYMNKEAFNATIASGKMTYWSRSRNELWVKGETSGHFQYVKSLTADCDFDTILAKVSQIGAACHTGNRTCFFNNIIKKEYVEKSPIRALDSIYKSIKDFRDNASDRVENELLLDSGTDEILQNVGEKFINILLSYKSIDETNFKIEMSDFLCKIMILMVEKGVTWEDIIKEMSSK
ncbi:bifunctional phosphoribosyl-AMP cyclohydrolase/phosphoribosyl-ATP diphosphatase HisIE [Lachnobacterium bovis]|uniref:Phosphoribosyl-AMP cyclohydrolase n=1 Tax=Lachnobacterium bovis TaxID=140626 RepID=A0A1H9QQL7_9FIRM|nr:bifunctional phosphoribosyl-AMP cyclohydrolase/phosphoribosyl-ATP diphosphatase HisIE [Lachnobacterium bovis]SER62710.1 phosphoribosyl-AMP cyclohydrolase [Lachnobacterium bovis]